MLNREKKGISNDDFDFDIYEIKKNSNEELCIETNGKLCIVILKSGAGYIKLEEKLHKINENDIFLTNMQSNNISITEDGTVLETIYINPISILHKNYLQNEDFSLARLYDIQISNMIEKVNRCHEELLQVLNEIAFENKDKQEGYKLIIQSLCLKLLILVHRILIKENIKATEKSNKASLKRIIGVVEYIDSNLDKKLKLEEMAKIAHMNKTYFSTYFKNVMDMNISVYIEISRIKNACRLLQTTDHSIIQIAEMVGFNSISNFNKTFREYMGITPMKFRKFDKTEQKTQISENLISG